MKTFLHRRLVLSLATAAVAAGLAAAWWLGGVALRPVAMYSGWLLLALVLGLTLINARKRLPFLPLFSVSTWLQAHVYAGWLAAGVFLLHVGFRFPDGRLELALAGVFLAVAASGVGGLWLSRWLPPRLTRSGENLIYEQIPTLRHALADEARTLVRQAASETNSTTLADFYLQTLAPYFARVPGLLAPLTGDEAAHHAVQRALGSLGRYLHAREGDFAARIGELVEAKRNLDLQLAGQRLLKLWLFVHIPLTGILVVLVAAHVWLALAFSHRL